MRNRIRSGLVIAERQLLESLLSPGYYIILAVSVALGCLLAAAFAGSVDSSGFNPQMSPVYDLIFRSLAGAFGGAFVDKLFAEGPFLFALLAAWLPLSLYLALASVFRFGQEKDAGAVELLVYGPADGTSYLLATFFRDLVLSAISLVVIALTLLVAALIGNLAPGPLFFWSLALLFLLSLPFFAYGILCSILTAGSSSAVALFIGITLVFCIILAGSFAITGSSVRTLSSAAGAVLSWISPFFYAGVFYRGVQAGNALAAAAGMVLLALLTAGLLALGRLAFQRKGVRA